MTLKDPELQDDLLEWWLCYSDADCGLKSATGAMIETLRIKKARLSDDAEEAARAYRLRDVVKARLTIGLGRNSSPFETEAALFYAEKFGVGVCAAPGANQDMHAATSPDLYGDGQCTLRSNHARDHRRTYFAQSRTCYLKWRALSQESRRALASHYLGMNPEAPADKRAIAQQLFGDLASAAWWFLEDEALEAAQNDNALAAIFRSVVETDVRRAHRAWQAA